MGDLRYLRGRQLVLVFITIFSDGRYDPITVNIGPSNSEKFLRKWGQTFVEGIWEASQKIPGIDECRLTDDFIDAYDPKNDQIIVPGANPKEIAWRYLAVMVPLISRRIS